MAARYVHGCQVFHLHTILLEFISFLSSTFLLLMALFSVLFICLYFLQFSFQLWIVFTIS